jgi:hypothetical protein
LNVVFTWESADIKVGEGGREKGGLGWVSRRTLEKFQKKIDNPAPCTQTTSAPHKKGKSKKVQKNVKSSKRNTPLK